MLRKYVQLYLGSIYPVHARTHSTRGRYLTLNAYFLSLCTLVFQYPVFMQHITQTRPCNIQQYFTAVKNVHFQMKFVNIFLIFAQNIDCGYTLDFDLRRVSEAVLTSTHNLCFGAKIRKNVYPCKPQFYYIKVGCKGVFITRTCFRDELNGVLVCWAVAFFCTSSSRRNVIQHARDWIS